MIPGINGSVLASAYKTSKLKRRYADGGPIKPSAKLNSVDPQGQASYQAGLQSGPVNLGLRGAANISQFKNTSLQPSLEYKAKSLSTYLNPENVGGSYQGKSTYLNADYNIPTQQTNLAAGYNSDKLSLNANANLEKNKLMGAGVDASYNVTPNLSVFGDLRWDKQEGQAPTSYNVGFSYKKAFKDGGTLPPIRTSNPRDPSIRSYNDSLNLHKSNASLAEMNRMFKEIKTDPSLKYYRPATRAELNSFPGKIKPTLGTTFDVKKLTNDIMSGKQVKYSWYRYYDKDGNYRPDIAGIANYFKEPAQPYVYTKPEITPEAEETPIPSAPVEQPVKKVGYNKPIIQQFNYMSNENKAKALQKYGSVSDIPFQGVDINQLKKGGEVENSNDKEMVEGVASILRDVKSKKNRLQLANKLAKQFNREKVDYNLSDFLNKSKVRK